MFQAVHLPLNRPCALKLLRDGALASIVMRERFLTEIEAVATLNHPQIIHVWRAAKHEGQLFLEMELVEGGTLADRLESGCLPAREAAALVAGLSRAVQHAHERGVLHRDLKPANILLDDAGSGPKLTDFGLARLLNHESDLTRTLAVLGTPAYMAPELASGQAREATIAADVYSLGAILYECLAGQPPFHAENVPALLRKAAEEAPSPEPLLQPRTRSEQRPEQVGAAPPPVPRDLVTICLRCLAKNPAHRFSSAGDLADELDRFLKGEPILSRAVPLVERVWLWCQRRPALAMALALGALGILAGLAGVTWQWQRAERANLRASHLLAENVVAQADAEFAAGEQNAALTRVCRFLAESSHPSGMPAYLQARLISQPFLVPSTRLFDHLGELNSGTFDVARKRIVTAGINGVRVLDYGSGQCLAHLEKGLAVYTAWTGASNDVVLTTDPSAFVRLWDTSLPSQPAMTGGLTGGVYSAVDPGRTCFCAASASGACWFGALVPGKVPSRMPDLASLPEQLALGANGDLIAAVLKNGQLVAKTAQSPGWQSVAVGFTNWTRLFVSPQAQFVAMCNQTRLTTFRFPGGERAYDRDFGVPITAGAVSFDGKWIAVSTKDGGLYLFDATHGEIKGEKQKQANSAYAMTFTMSGRHLVTAGNDGCVRLLTVAPWRPLTSVDSRHFVCAADFDETTGLLLAATEQDKVQFFHYILPATNAVSAVLPGLVGGVPLPEQQGLLALSSEGDVVLARLQETKVSIETICTIPNAAALAADSRSPEKAWVGDKEGSIFEVPVRRGAVAKRLMCVGNAPQLMAFNSMARCLAIAVTNTNLLTLVDLSRSTGVAETTHGIRQHVRSLQFNPKGTALAAGCWDNTVVLFDSQKRVVRWVNDRQHGPVFGLAFSPDGQRLAAASLDKSIWVLDVATGRVLAPVLHTATEPFTLGYSPAGDLLAAGAIGQVVVWDVVTGG